MKTHLLYAYGIDMVHANTQAIQKVEELRLAQVDVPWSV
jgi:hypothetical protein